MFSTAIGTPSASRARLTRSATRTTAASVKAMGKRSWQHLAPHGAEAQMIGVPGRAHLPDEAGELREVRLIERIGPAERHRQPVREDADSARAAAPSAAG